MEKEIAYFTQLIALIIIILVLIYNVESKSIQDAKIQLILSIIVMIIFVTIDPLAGFLLACAVFIVYYKSFMKIKLGKKVHWGKDNMYINEKNLQQIQNNVFDEKNMKNEILGFNDGFIKSENSIYGIQGMNDTMPGYDYDKLYPF